MKKTFTIYFLFISLLFIMTSALSCNRTDADAEETFWQKWFYETQGEYESLGAGEDDNSIEATVVEPEEIGIEDE